MKKKQLIFVFSICFLLVNSLASESSITNAYACTNLKIRDDQKVFFGNNEDHAFIQISDTVITFLPSGQVWPDGSTLEYGAVVVGYANGSGYSWFQGGMNEKGLAFDLTSVPYTEPNLHDERFRSTVPEIFSCATIGEVIEYKKTHNVYQQEGGIQSFFVDISGESVVFHIGEGGEYDFFRNNESFQLASNFYMDDPSRGNPGSDAIRRYDVAEQILNNIVTNDNILIESIASVLDAVHFEGPLVNTLYSNVFDVTNGDIYLYCFHQYEEVVKLNLEDELAKGRHAYQISDLFTQETVGNAYDEYYEYPYVIRVFPTDLLLLVMIIVLDAFLVLASMYIACKRLFNKITMSRNKTQEKNEKHRQSNELRTYEATYRGLFIQIILSLAITWSFLSFPMIYWNHKGEWFSIDILPFFDIIPLSFLQWPLQAFYASHNLFLLMSLLGIVLIAFLLALFANRMEAVQLVKRGLDLGKEKKRRRMVILSIPVLIGIFSLFLEILDVIPKVDWLMFAIMYPLIVTMLTMLTPYAEKKGIKKHGFPQNRSRINLVKASNF